MSITVTSHQNMYQYQKPNNIKDSTPVYKEIYKLTWCNKTQRIYHNNQMIIKINNYFLHMKTLFTWQSKEMFWNCNLILLKVSFNLEMRRFMGWISKFKKLR